MHLNNSVVATNQVSSCCCWCWLLSSYTYMHLAVNKRYLVQLNTCSESFSQCPSCNYAFRAVQECACAFIIHISSAYVCEIICNLFGLFKQTQTEILGESKKWNGPANCNWLIDSIWFNIRILISKCEQKSAK